MAEAGFTGERDTGTHNAKRLQSEYWLHKCDQLLLASCIELIVTAIFFAIRGDAITTL